MNATQDTPSHLLGIDASGRVSLPLRAETVLESFGAKFGACDAMKPTPKDKKAAASFLKNVHYTPGIGDIASDVKERMNALGTALEKLDKNTKNPKIVVNKQRSMEELVLALQRALAMAENPSAKADEVISYIREQLENIQNPHRALEQEWFECIRAKNPPNGELYSVRVDKSELAVAFFMRVYGKFYRAGLVYKHQLRLLDTSLLNNLGHYTGEVQLKPKKDFNTAVASKVLSAQSYAQSAVLSVLSRKYA